MTRIVTILAKGFADWECALVNAAARSYFGAETHFAAPGGAAVTSMGGMTVTPDLALESLDLDGVGALLVCGGTVWQSPEAPDLSDLLRRAREKGLLIGGICDGTRALARAGLLDGVDHTSNSADNLTDVPGYAGATRYRDVPHAVADGNIVTAPGSAPVGFMAEISRALGYGGENLDFFVGLHAAEHGRRGAQG